MNVSTAKLSGDASVLKRVPGAPNPDIINQINQLSREAFANDGGTYTVIEGSDQASNEFPYRPFVHDTYDSIARLKQQVTGGKYKVTFDKEDAEYLLRQRAQVENADYDRWVMQKYDLSNPAQNMLLQKLDPDQFKRRMDLLRKQIELESRYAEVRMMGPKSEDDLKFEWLIETGRIELPEGPMWDPTRWMQRQLQTYQRSGVGYSNTVATKMGQVSKANRQRMTEGFFNPLDFPNEGQTGWQANRNNYSDIRGIHVAPMYGQLFSGSEGNGPYRHLGAPPITDNVIVSQNPATNNIRYGTGYQDSRVITPYRAPQPARAAVKQVVDPVTGKVIVPAQKAVKPVKERPGVYEPARYPPVSLDPLDIKHTKDYYAAGGTANTRKGYGNFSRNI